MGDRDWIFVDDGVGLDITLPNDDGDEDGESESDDEDAVARSE